TAIVTTAVAKSNDLGLLELRGTGETVMSRFPNQARLRHCLVLAPLVGLLLPGAGLGQALNPNQREALPKINVEDKDDIRNDNSKIWVLDFKFYDPRLITVDIPGRGRRLCWYMKYQVINNAKDGQPHTFYPSFELVPLDRPGEVHK